MSHEPYIDTYEDPVKAEILLEYRVQTIGSFPLMSYDFIFVQPWHTFFLFLTFTTLLNLRHFIPLIYKLSIIHAAPK